MARNKILLYALTLLVSVGAVYALVLKHYDNSVQEGNQRKINQFYQSHYQGVIKRVSKINFSVDDDRCERMVVTINANGVVYDIGAACFDGFEGFSVGDSVMKVSNSNTIISINKSPNVICTVKW